MRKIPRRLSLKLLVRMCLHRPHRLTDNSIFNFLMGEIEMNKVKTDLLEEHFLHIEEGFILF